MSTEANIHARGRCGATVTAGGFDELEEVAAADDVEFAYTITGTHHGTPVVCEPAGWSFRIRGMQPGRFEGGRPAVRWGNSDQPGLLTCAGLAPQP